MRPTRSGATSWCRRVVAAPAVALALAAMSLSGASAQNADTPPTAVLFILDLSGSMNEPYDDGRTKLDVAKEAFTDALSRPQVEEVQIGLRTYGDQLDAQPPAGRRQNCETDTRLVTPIGAGNRDAVLQEIDGFEARGDTPIALALEAAKGDVPEGALTTVVLFSDGRDECHDADLDGDAAAGPSWGRDPCDVAREVADAGVDLRIDKIETIGFQAADAEEQLRCIAESTGGRYHPVDTHEDVEDLPDVFGEIVSPRDAVRLGGEPIKATPTADGAPELARIATGQSNRRYTDTIGINEERWYRIRDYGPGEGHTTATVFGLPPVEAITLELRWEPGPDENLNLDIVEEVQNVPNAPSDSVRCGGCYITSGDSHDVYFVVALRSDDPGVTGEFDLELLLEGIGWGGPDQGCQEGTECWYEGQIEAAGARLADLEAQVGAGGDLGPLRDEIADLETELAALTERREMLEEGPEQRTSWVLPLVLAVVMLGLGEAWSVLARRSRAESAAADPARPAEAAETRTDAAVIGRLDLESPTEAAPAPAKSPADDDGAAAVGEPVTATAEGTDGLPERVEEVPLPAAEVVHADHPMARAAGPERGQEAPLPEAQADPSGTGAGAAPPAGWYRDPDEPTGLRWWDGSTWTDHARKD